MTKESYTKLNNEPYNIPMTIKMTQSMHEWIINESEVYGIPISVITRALIQRGINSIENNRKML